MNHGVSKDVCALLDGSMDVTIDVEFKVVEVPRRRHDVVTLGPERVHFFLSNFLDFFLDVCLYKTIFFR